MTLVELVRALENHSAAGPFIRSMTTPQALARAAAGHVGPSCAGAQVRVQDGAGGHVFCCFHEVARALGCALQNAAESQAGSGEPILVRVSHNEGDAVIEVIDHGCGLGAMAPKRLFTPFVSSKPGHAGLGLCVARAIMERNDGRLDLAPGDDGGTVARFTLPRVKGTGGTGKETL
jgi:nitrogen fixation/metabolism regulation signal transduction histidine kinase